MRRNDTLQGTCDTDFRTNADCDGMIIGTGLLVNPATEQGFQSAGGVFHNIQRNGSGLLFERNARDQCESVNATD